MCVHSLLKILNTAVTPASGAIGVASNAGIELVFSAAVNPATINSTDIRVTAPEAIAGSVSYIASTNAALFTPAAPLAPNSTYTVTVSGVTSSSGTAMANPFTWSFATVASTPSSPTPTPTPTGGAATQYTAPLVAEAGLTAINGQISIDTTGMVTIQLAGATASTTYAVEFCPAVNPTSSTTTSSACISLGNVTTDGSGNSTSTVQFPQPGSWAGDFNVDTGGKTVYQTWIGTAMSGETYMSTLQPESTVNGTGISSGLKQAALTSGTVSFANTAITFTVTGTSADSTVDTSESETVYLNGSGTYELSTFTTNANGDGSSTTQLNSPGGDIFEVDFQGSPVEAGFIGGFSVPAPSPSAAQ